MNELPEGITMIDKHTVPHTQNSRWWSCWQALLQNPKNALVLDLDKLGLKQHNGIVMSFNRFAKEYHQSVKFSKVQRKLYIYLEELP